MRVITKPNGQPVTLGEYVRSWRILLTLDPGKNVDRWSWFPVTAREILRDIRAGIHDRINRHVPGYGHGRKWDGNYQASLWRDSRRVREARRVRFYQFETAEARARFSHLFSSHDD